MRYLRGRLADLPVRAVLLSFDANCPACSTLRAVTVVPATTVYATLRGFRALGLDAGRLARAVDLPEERPEDPFAVMPDGTFGQLWAAAFEADSRPHLPVLVGRAIPFGAFGLTDYLVGSAPTVGKGLATLATYFRLVSPTARLELEEGRVRIRNRLPSPTDAVSDAFTLAVIAARFSARLPACSPLAVHLVQPSGVPVEPFERAFGCTVRLGQPQSVIVFPPGAWTLPLRRPDPALHTTLKALANRADVRSYAASPLAYAIRLRLPEALQAGCAGAEEIAGSLNMSLRTLQRRLADEGTRFKEVLDEYRREEAVRALKAGATNAEVAARLGYTEPTSFTRAFRRWYGVAPSCWQRDHRNTAL